MLQMCCGFDATLCGLMVKQNMRQTRAQETSIDAHSKNNPWTCFVAHIYSFARIAAVELIQFRRKKKETGIHLTPCFFQLLVCTWDINPAGAHKH